MKPNFLIGFLRREIDHFDMRSNSFHGFANAGFGDSLHLSANPPGFFSRVIHDVRRSVQAEPHCWLSALSFAKWHAFKVSAVFVTYRTDEPSGEGPMIGGPGNMPDFKRRED